MKYSVVFDPFADRHHIKRFAKKYMSAWDKTYKALLIEFTFADILFEKNIAETICISKDDNIRICKTEFKISGTDVSRHASGNRCIIAIHKDISTVKVLLVYAKTDAKAKNETAWWKSIIKDNYSEYKNLF